MASSECTFRVQTLALSLSRRTILEGASRERQQFSPCLGYTKDFQYGIDGSMRSRSREPLQIGLHDCHLPIQANVHEDFSPNRAQKLPLDIRRLRLV